MANRNTFGDVGWFEPGLQAVVGTFYLSGTSMTAIKAKGVTAVGRTATGVYHITFSQGYPTNHPAHFDFKVIGTGSALNDYRMTPKSWNLTGSVPTLTVNLTTGSFTSPTLVDPLFQFVTASMFGIVKNSTVP